MTVLKIQQKLVDLATLSFKLGLDLPKLVSKNFIRYFLRINFSQKAAQHGTHL
jgi:hypothetical protein